MSTSDKDRDTYTVIGGRAFSFLECVIRFERSAGGGSVWFIDGSCKRIGLADDQTVRSDVTLVGNPYAEHSAGRFELYDARIVVDTDGEEWVETELGLNCPRCLEHERALYRIVEQTGINPFTNSSFVRDELADVFHSEEEFGQGILDSEGLGRPLAINEAVKAAATARSLRHAESGR